MREFKVNDGAVKLFFRVTGSLKLLKGILEFEHQFA
jgi:hypothetical protein